MSDVKAAGALVEIEISVPGMMCEGCAEKVSKVLTALPGVLKVRPSAWRKRVTVRYQLGRVGEDTITEALAAAGFEAIRQ